MQSYVCDFGFFAPDPGLGFGTVEAQANVGGKRAAGWVLGLRGRNGHTGLPLS